MGKSSENNLVGQPKRRCSFREVLCLRFDHHKSVFGSLYTLFGIVSVQDVRTDLVISVPNSVNIVKISVIRVRKIYHYKHTDNTDRTYFH